jgi:anti-sigma factor ChrR (cupin superfamily)
MTAPSKAACERTERVAEYALRGMPADERPAFEAHVGACPECRQELLAVRPIVDTFADWPIDVLTSPRPLWGRLAEHLSAQSGGPFVAEPEPRWNGEPDWKEVAPGISCKLLATDAARGQVSMLVRLAPGVAYPPHRHEGVEELHLLDGELWIDDRKLCAGDYNRAEPGTEDKLVWSETGCTCVLMTSVHDVLR